MARYKQEYEMKKLNGLFMFLSIMYTLEGRGGIGMEGFTGGYNIIVVVLVVGGLLFAQYKRIHDFEYKTMGFSKTTLRMKIISAMMIGGVGGIVGTIAILLLGVTVKQGDFIYLLPMALLLMLINVRYLCFAYGGGLLALSSLLLDFPQINIPNLMTIVGILHLVESVLIWLDGHENAVPIFMEDEKYGIVGGFILQRFWPIPFVVWLVMMGALGSESLPFQMSMVVAALGYSDIAVSTTPNKRSKISAARLFVYSIILILFSMMAKEYNILQWVVVFFAPLGHEALVLWGKRDEKRSVPLFRHHGRGVTVLDVKKDGYGNKIGLKPGTVILRINNHSIDNKQDIYKILNELPQKLWMDITDEAGGHKTIEYRNSQAGIDSLGVIIIPKASTVIFQPNLDLCPMKKWMARLKS